MRWLNSLVLTVVFAAPAFGQVQLRFQFHKGEVLRQKVTQEMNSVAHVQGQEIKTALAQTMHLEQAIGDVAADGSADVRQKINRIQMSMEMPFGQGFNFDSADENGGEVPPGVGPMLKQLAGAEFQGRLSPTGQMTDITIPEQLKKALNSIPGSPFGRGEDAIQQLVSQSSTTFPAKAVNKGDTWTDDVAMTMPFGEMKIKRTNSYAGTNDDGLHVVDIKLAIEIVPGENQPVRMALKDSTAEGTMLFDNAAGRLVSTVIKQVMTMEASVAGQTFEQTIHQTMKVEQEPNASSD